MSLRVERISAAGPEEDVLREAAGMIKAGLVVVCPTDTGYAFAANALDEKAVRRVFALKGRSFSNPVHVAVPSMEEADKYAHLNAAVFKLARRFLPGALTLVLPRKETVPDLLVAGMPSVGIRVPDNKAVLALAGMCGLPLTATSANISGRPTPYSGDEVMARMGADAEVALVLDQGEISSRELSTIVDLTADRPRLLRQGLIPWEEVLQVLR